MPLQWRLHVLEARLRERLAAPVRFEEVELYRLEGPDRTAAIDAMVSGAELPLVIVRERVVCTGSPDAVAIETAIRELW